MSDFSTQHRGRRDDYDRYLAGMDASMRQKVALTAAHLLGRGRVADMGMGSGAGSHALAALYPELRVVGVDLDPTMVALARERYRMPNLSFEAGDIATRVFEEGSLDAILDSSVLHHVTSFNGYEHSAAGGAVAAQVGQLAEHGVLIIRDFLDPGEGQVLLDLPTDDGDQSDDPNTCSSSALFERFAREFRSLAPAPGFELRPVGSAEPAEPSRPPLRSGRRRYAMPYKIAVEFLLRKDYRTDWVAEVKEEYTYFTQSEFERRFSDLGLRVLVSTPLFNPWIIRHRFADRFEMWTANGAPVDFPATNYVIVGEKVSAGEGVRFVDVGEAPSGRFLETSHYEHRTSGRVRDLVRRPNSTIDVLPWFDVHGEVFVVVRGSYPRPVLACEPFGTTPIDGSRPPHYVTEPLTVIQGDKPLAQTAEDLLTSVGFSGDDVRTMTRGVTYYPSPGGVQEEVRSVLVEVSPVMLRDRLPAAPGMSTGGRVRAIEAQQLLRAAQVGGLPDARLELNVYELFRRSGASTGPWIADVGALATASSELSVSDVSTLARRPSRRVFKKAPAERSSGFLQTTCRLFRELDSRGNSVGEKAFEFVTPRRLSFNTASVAVLAKQGDDLLIGVDDDDLPAAQCFNGGSELLVTPAWRLPRDVVSATPMRAWIRERFAEEYDLELGEIWELGGRYHPSPGVTPEVVHPLATSVVKQGPRGRRLQWIKLADLVRGPEELLLDGHLRIAAFRAAHACGVLA